MTDTARARKLTPRGTRRRSELMATATTQFARRGYHPTSVADIVGELGVGKGVFYWYFDSKEQLFREILRDAQRSLRRFQRDRVSGIEDPVARIAGGLRAAVEWSAEHRDLIAVLELAESDETFTAQIRRGSEVSAGDVIPHLREAIASGAIAARDPQMLAYAILGVASNLTRTFIHRMASDVDAVADEVVTFCLVGIGADGDSGQLR